MFSGGWYRFRTVSGYGPPVVSRAATKPFVLACLVVSLTAGCHSSPTDHDAGPAGDGASGFWWEPPFPP